MYLHAFSLCSAIGFDAELKAEDDGIAPERYDQ